MVIEVGLPNRLHVNVQNDLLSFAGMNSRFQKCVSRSDSSIIPNFSFLILKES